jgi:O-antigen ligase
VPLAAFITILNALANNRDVVLEYRIKIGGLPINGFDILLLVGGLVSLWRAGKIRTRGTSLSLLFWTITSAYFAAALFSSISALSQGTPARFWVTAARNYLALPASALIGYELLSRSREWRRFVWIVIGAGVSVSFVVFEYFLARGAELSPDDSINFVRTVQYVTNYASLALCVVMFAEMRGLRLMPTWLTFGVAAVCFVGQFATLSRSEWLATTAGVLAIVFLLVSRRRARARRGAMLGLAAIAAGVLITVQGASFVMDRDFGSVLSERFESMLPGESQSGGPKAWESRIPAARAELQLWAEAPVIGRGFGVQERAEDRFGYAFGSWRHNTFTSILAETGIVGILPVIGMFGALFVVGRRLALETSNPPSLLVGALGVACGTFYVVLGLSTLSFNQMRFAIPLGMIFGVTMRAGGRELEKAAIQAREERLRRAGAAPFRGFRSPVAACEVRSCGEGFGSGA